VLFKCPASILTDPNHFVEKEFEIVIAQVLLESLGAVSLLAASTGKTAKLAKLNKPLGEMTDG
jgi:hypothetical protein